MSLPLVADRFSSLRKACNVSLPDPSIEKPWTLQSYRANGGYQALEKVISGQIPHTEIINTIKQSNHPGAGRRWISGGGEMEFHAAQFASAEICGL